MNRLAKALAMVLAVSAFVVVQARADVFEYVPSPADLNDLDHDQAYTWGIDVSALQGWAITEVVLSFDNITNFDDAANTLWIHLLDNAPLGVQSFADGQDFVDRFQGQGPLIAEWHDVNGSGTTEDLSFSLSALSLITTVRTYCGDGVLAFAFDPDCHYWNDGVKVTIRADLMVPVQGETWTGVKGLYRD